MELVKFENGKYGVRIGRSWLGKSKFVSLYRPSITWTKRECIVDYCQGTKEQALYAMREHRMKYTIENESE